MKRRACREEEKATRNADGQERRRLPPPGGETPMPRPSGPVTEYGRAPCGVPDCTFRKVLEYLPQSTLTVSARRCGASRTGNTAQGADGIGRNCHPARFPAKTQPAPRHATVCMARCVLRQHDASFTLCRRTAAPTLPSATPSPREAGGKVRPHGIRSGSKRAEVQDAFV